MENEQPATKPVQKNPPRLFEGAMQNKKNVLKSIGLGILFWIVQYIYQYAIISAGDAQLSIIRSAAFTGATLIGIALLIGPLVRLFASRNYIVHRRTIGVIGFTFIIVHYLSALIFSFKGNLFLIFFDFNPYVNPVIFGILAFCLYIPLYLTSTDWAVRKLGFKKWKAIHRLVYVAFIITVIHFILINPPLLFNAAGYLLLAVTALVFITEIAAFVKHVKSHKGKGMVIGMVIIVFGIALFFLAYAINKNSIILYGIPIMLAGLLVLFLVKRKPKTSSVLTPSQISSEPSQAASNRRD